VNSCSLDVNKAIARFRNSNVPEDILVDLVHDSMVVRYEKDARLFLRGTPADNVMLVITGAVKIYCPQSGGRSVMFGLAGPGEVIGFADFVDPKGRACTTFEAQALTNCSVMLISRQRIERGLSRLESAVLVSVLAAANTFWTAIAYRCVSMLGITFRERLESVIAEVAEKFGVNDARGTLLRLELSHDEWAAMIGSSRSLASKLISEMVEEGMLERNGKRYTVLRRAVPPMLQNGQSERVRPETGNGSSGNGRAWPIGTTLSASVPITSPSSRRLS
jgi:CRP-like cAMP-binding protein